MVFSTRWISISRCFSEIFCTLCRALSLKSTLAARGDAPNDPSPDDASLRSSIFRDMPRSCSGHVHRAGHRRGSTHATNVTEPGQRRGPSRAQPVRASTRGTRPSLDRPPNTPATASRARPS